MEKVKSDLTGKEYSPSKCVRIINIFQAMFYWNSGVKPVDIYTSIEFNTSRPVFVFIFDKNQTKSLYTEWLNNRHQEEENNDK